VFSSNNTATSYVMNELSPITRDITEGRCFGGNLHTIEQRTVSIRWVWLVVHKSLACMNPAAHRGSLASFLGLLKYCFE
jgi:hypothetical protein